jgi:hypothetical protein
MEGREGLEANFRHIWKSLKKEMIFEITTMSDGDCIAEHEIMSNTTMSNSILTVLPTELIYFSVYELMSLISIADVRLLRLNMRTFMTNFEVVESYLKLKSWEIFKKCMVDNTIHTKLSNRRNDNPRAWVEPPLKTRSVLKMLTETRGDVEATLERKNFREEKNPGPMSNYDFGTETNPHESMNCNGGSDE